MTYPLLTDSLRSEWRLGEPEALRVMLAGHGVPALAALRLLVQGEWGWTVVREATDGLQAVRLAREERPDVVLLDAGRDAGVLGEVTEMLETVPTVVVLLLDSPAQHVHGRVLTMLKGVPSGRVRRAILEEVRRLSDKRRAG
jgi:DNA-binding NarL/FixJ family response regulator